MDSAIKALLTFPEESIGSKIAHEVKASLYYLASFFFSMSNSGCPFVSFEFHQMRILAIRPSKKSEQITKRKSQYATNESS
jgi:hypothetical protein